MLELKEISLLVPGKPQELVLLGDISTRIPAGQFVAIVGPSGCGKSTLLKAIAGLTDITFGNLIWKGRDLEEEGDLEPHEIGYVPQFSIAYELLTVQENLDTALRLRISGLSSQQRQEKATQILAQVGLEAIADRQVRVLSGGQKRRLALALELATSPDLLLCDEVTSGLDPKAEDELVHLLKALTKENCRTVLSVTHSLTHLDIYDTVIVLHSGHLAYHGAPQFLTHYFQIEEPADLYPQLALRKPEEWHRSWKKHRTAYQSEGATTSAEPALPISTPEEEGEASEEPGDPRYAATIRVPLRKEEVRITLGKKKTLIEEDKETPQGLTLLENPEILPPKEGQERHEADLPDLEPTTPPSPPPSDAPHSRSAPGAISQFITLFGRRWRLFFRDPSAIWLQLALIVGFPCLVVIFALDGLPQIQNLSQTHTSNIIEIAKESAEFLAQATRSGSLVSGLIMFQVILLTLMASNNASREIAGERLIFEKEKFGGLKAGAYVASKAAFLLFIILAQSIWMGLFVKLICRFPGDLLLQIGVLTLVNTAMTSVCLAISSISRTAEQSSLTCIYLVGFQLPLSGAVLALPGTLGAITRPFIAAYWGWSGYLETVKETRFYDVVQIITQTPLSPGILCFWVLATQILIGLFICYAGCKSSRWPD